MTNKYKVAINAITLNEVHFADRFMATLNEADMVIVADTGSTDGTVEKLRSLGAIVHEIKVLPWRFDVPRNVALHLVPEDVDIVVPIDLDEILLPGWRKALEDAWTPETTRLRYPYTWSFKEDGSPDVTFYYDKIHARKGYRWVHPVHEVITPQIGTIEKFAVSDGVILHHYPDKTKSRGSYLPLLELSTKEDPMDDRNSHYLAREYTFYSKWEEAIIEAKRHLELPTAKWNCERASSMRLISQSYRNLGYIAEAKNWLFKAIAEDNTSRESFVDLSDLCQATKDWLGSYNAAIQALSITNRNMSYMSKGYCWGAKPHDLASVSAWYLGLKKESIQHAKNALAIEPNDKRLQENLKLIEELIKNGA